MLSKKIKVLLLLALILFFSGSFLNYVNAASCNSSNLFLSRNAEVGWGDTPLKFNWSPIPVTPNSQVRLSVGGEDGCAGQNVSFQIKQNGSVIKTISGSLVLGRKTTAQTYQLYYDWTSDVPVGTYKFRATSAGFALFSGDSSNDLKIEQNSQACRLSTVNTTPPSGTTYGTPIKINVNAQGVCQGWEASVNIYEISGGQNKFIVTLTKQKFSSGGNTLVFSWDPVRNPGVGLQAVYRADAIVGSQTLPSNGFIVSGTSEDGDDILPTKPGKNISLNWDITNPLVGNPQDVFGVIVLVSNWLLNIAGTLIVILIIYSGVRFMLSRGNPSEYGKAKTILLWALVGFAVILIGKGFVFIVDSVLRGQKPF